MILCQKKVRYNYEDTLKKRLRAVRMIDDEDLLRKMPLGTTERLEKLPYPRFMMRNS